MVKLSARAQAGQRIFIGFPGTEADDALKDMIINYKIANFILFRHNIESLPQVRRLCKDIERLVMEQTGYSAFIAVDQEGGMVTRLGQDGVNMPGAMAIAAAGSLDYAYQAGRITAEQLCYAGINFNLAPTADVNSNIDNPVIGVRSFGDQPEQVAGYAAAMTRGLLDGGVLACAKHFPGHGDTNVDSHLGLPRIDKTLKELNNCELVPFLKLIKAGIPAVMTSHILFPELETKELPVTMSRSIITGLLRERLGFKGLIVSDCMEMNAIKKYYGTVQGVLGAVRAGVDMVFISHTMSVAREVSDRLTAALEDNEIPSDEMEASVGRILKQKRLLDNYPKAGVEFDIEGGKSYALDLLKKSITPVSMPTDTLPEIGPRPLFIGAPLFRATNVSNSKMEEIQFSGFLAKRFGGDAVVTGPDPTDDEVLKAMRDAEGYSSIVIGTYNGHLYRGQLKIIRQAAKRHTKVIVFALRNPYDLRELPKPVYGIAVYEYTEKSLEIIAQLLEHRFIPTGRLPVKM